MALECYDPKQPWVTVAPDAREAMRVECREATISSLRGDSRPFPHSQQVFSLLTRIPHRITITYCCAAATIWSFASCRPVTCEQDVWNDPQPSSALWGHDPLLSAYSVPRKAR